MKHKFVFGLQVFSILAIFVTIFVTYLLWDKTKDFKAAAKYEIQDATNVVKHNSSTVFYN